MKMYLAMAGCVFLLAQSVVSLAQASPSRPAITGISHVCIYTTNAAKSDAFYQHDLGATKRPDPENPLGVRYYFSPVQYVEVLPLPSTETSINRLDHVAFNTADAAGLRLYMAAHRITVPEKIENASDGSSWFEVRDPEGNRVQFVQPSAKESDVPLDAFSSHIIHLGYMVRDDKTENEFYRVLLGFRPYWFGGRADTPVDWISQQVPDGTDWIEYMMVRDPEQVRIPASVTKTSLGTMDHIALGVPSMKVAYETLYTGDRLNNRNAGGIKIARDGKWQFNMYDADDTRVELMEFQPTVKPCCSPFTAGHPTR